MKQKQYIGLDAHSSTCSFCVLDDKGVALDERTIATNGRLIVDYLVSLPEPRELVVEECGISSWLFEIINPHVDKLIICDPVENRQYKKAKTDKLDAFNLASLLRGGFLHPVYHDGSHREKFRMLVSSYDDTVNEIVRMKNRYRALMRRTRNINTSLPTNKEQVEDILFIKELTHKKLAIFKDAKQQYQKRITEALRGFPESQNLLSITGIGHIHAAKIISQVIEPNRFRNKHKFYAYCGLVKHVCMSAKKVYGYKYIWGNRTLKTVYKMAAHSAIRSHGSLRAYYDFLLTKGTSENNARNAVARKIATLSLVLWRKNERFNDKKITQSLMSI
jgi:transposase